MSRPSSRELVLRERRAHRGDDRFHGCLPESDHVRVALHDDRPILLRDRRPCEVEAVEDASLLEELALGCVHVLAPERVVVAEATGLEADHAAPRVGEREHQPEREVVVAAPVCEPGRLDLVNLEAPLACLGDEPHALRQTEPELLRDLLAQLALLEVLTHGGADVRFPQDPFEVGRRLLEERGQSVTAAAGGVLSGRRLLVLERHAEAVGEPLDRVGEDEVLGLLDEADDVAALPAAEAVVELLDGVDREARCPLLVEGATPRKAGAGGPPQRRARGDDLDDVGRRLDLGDAALLDPRHPGDPTPPVGARRTRAQSGRSSRRDSP